MLDIFASDWIVRDIEDLFVDARFIPTDEELPASGERRRAAMQFIHGLDLTDPVTIQRLLPIFDEVLGDMGTDWRGEPEAKKAKLALRLEMDGFARGSDGKLRPMNALPVAVLSAPLLAVDVLHEHITRLEEAMNKDVGDVIGMSKELIESACMVVLDRTGQPYDKKDEVPALVAKATAAIMLDAASVAPTSKSQGSVKKILGNLSNLAIGVAELRNELGRGHGRNEVIKLPQRHAHLAAGAALTFARMLLETLEDPRAPWKASTTSS